ncbi:WD-40 repeat protein [Reticulomyxa filosa]|uniref:WD-40 repeat protein n=1 Tax=Reticulomyxa filosa TaxID=46433 RepID=X6MLZ8_RETFI|nr:WD-40 repeat protein [Reticulomyxa filosa]|eukprot:ETO15038.1 WD-40 repeat protein [Reticulomyxa filosa]
MNTILSGSWDAKVCLWDIRSNKQIQVFNGHKSVVWSAEYSPFVIKNDIKVINSNINVICSGSLDNTIRFWDIRSNKNELYVMNVNGVVCLKFIEFKKKVNNNEQKLNVDSCVNLCYGSNNSLIYVCG